jgi:hypothetical protein
VTLRTLRDTASADFQKNAALYRKPATVTW